MHRSDSQKVRRRPAAKTSKTLSVDGGGDVGADRAEDDDVDAHVDLRKLTIPEEMHGFLQGISCEGRDDDDPLPKTGSTGGRSPRTRRAAPAKPRVNSMSRKKREKEKDRTKEEPLSPAAKRPQHAEFTEYEIATLWNRFRDSCASPKLNKKQLMQMLKQVFLKCEPADLSSTVDNIFTIFDYDGCGQVAYRDLLIAFTLSMRGSVRDRLHWMFRFYDEDGGEEVYQKDMVKTLVRLCASTKSAENLGSQSAAKTAQQPQTDAVAETEKKPAADSSRTKPAREPLVPDSDQMNLLSSRLGQRVRSEALNQRKKNGTKKDAAAPAVAVVPAAASNDKDEDKERALEVVANLDADGDGFITREEFVEGCLSDGEFFRLVDNFNGDLIWGAMLANN